MIILVIIIIFLEGINQLYLLPLPREAIGLIKNNNIISIVGFNYSSFYFLA